MNIAKNNMGLKRKLLIAMLLPLLTSCAAYSSGFTCGDARGVACTSMERVDQLISSGEIETYARAKKKCRGRACTSLDRKDVAKNVFNKNPGL